MADERIAQAEQEQVEALDAALLAGTDIEDINKIRAITGRAQFEEIAPENPLDTSVEFTENPLDLSTVVENDTS